MRPLILLLISLAFAAGCSTSISRYERHTMVALAIRSAANATPTNEQLGSAVRTLQHNLRAAGYELVDTPQKAQYIISAEFVANPTDPAGGHLRIINAEPRLEFMKAVNSDLETEETKQMRERLKEIDRWVDMQWKTRPGEGAP